MMTRDQKDQIWDLFPSTFTIPVIQDPDNPIVFTSDTATVDNNVQILETFQPEEVRYPTIQIQYASANTRVNFFDFQFGDERQHSSYQVMNATDSWNNCQGTPIVLDLVADADDITGRVDFNARMPSTSVSYLRVTAYVNDTYDNYLQVSFKDYYYEEITETGATLSFDYDFDPNLQYKIQFSTFGDETGTDLGVEIELDVSTFPLHELYKYDHYEVHGMVENLMISIRVIAEDKLTYQEPGLGQYCEAQDIVDTIVNSVQTAFFTGYDAGVDSSALIKVENEYDVTAMISSGTEERLAARQIDFLVVNENKLRTQYTTAKSVDVLILTDSPSDTL